MEDSKSQSLEGEFYLDCGFATRALHAGEHVGQPQHRSHANAIYQTSTFVFENAAEGADIFAGRKAGYVYTRMGNPTVRLLEAKINALEGREVKMRNPDLRVSTLAFTSGMSAISSTLLAIASAGDTILLGDVVYGATEHLAFNALKRFGIQAIEVDTTRLEAVEAAVRAYPKARCILFETPTNPMLTLTDIEGVVALVRAHAPEMRVIVDNTFATPYLQNPLSLGADVVVHSTTKYLCGHGTIVGGMMTTTCDAVKDRAYEVIKDLGGNPSPFDTWLVNMGVKTLPVRMERHCDSAEVIARFLADHPKVEKVYFPGLPNHPGHDIARRQMRRFGGMVSFEVKGGIEAGRRVMDHIRIWTLAVSLGTVDSLIQHPASMTHAAVPREKRLKGGITDGLIRLSVGLEDVEDLVAALDKALSAA